MRELSNRGFECVGSDIHFDYEKIDAPYIQLDITNEADVDSAISKVKPDVVIHCAAWTAVDAAEESENIGKVKAIIDALFVLAMELVKKYKPSNSYHLPYGLREIEKGLLNNDITRWKLACSIQ